MYNFKTVKLFTFHYVSINTCSTYGIYLLIVPLHSTMFLLILNPALQEVGAGENFTFHYVSINTNQHP